MIKSIILCPSEVCRRTARQCRTHTRPPPRAKNPRTHPRSNTSRSSTKSKVAVALPFRVKEEWAEIPLPLHQAHAMEGGPQLTPVGEKSLPAKSKLGSLAYCPSMDLIALATEDDELRVFRLNGQRDFGGSFGGDPYLGEDEEDGEIRALVWKGNGEFVLLFITCDGMVCL